MNSPPPSALSFCIFVFGGFRIPVHFARVVLIASQIDPSGKFRGLHNASIASMTKSSMPKVERICLC